MRISAAGDPALIYGSANFLPCLTTLPTLAVLIHCANSRPVTTEFTAHIVHDLPDAV